MAPVHSKPLSKEATARLESHQRQLNLLYRPAIPFKSEMAKKAKKTKKDKDEEDESAYVTFEPKLNPAATAGEKGGTYKVKVLKFGEGDTCPEAFCTYQRKLESLIVTMGCELPKDKEKRTDAITLQQHVLYKATLTGKAAEYYETTFNDAKKANNARPVGPAPNENEMADEKEDDDDGAGGETPRLRVPLYKVLHYALNELAKKYFHEPL